uniref:Uncharacterized protein n=1 Tax=Arundo donax TaxID=35708 RepID=A0A0A9FI99_ARUDO
MGMAVEKSISIQVKACSALGRATVAPGARRCHGCRQPLSISAVTASLSDSSLVRCFWCPTTRAVVPGGRWCSRTHGRFTAAGLLIDNAAPTLTAVAMTRLDPDRRLEFSGRFNLLLAPMRVADGRHDLTMAAVASQHHIAGAWGLNKRYSRCCSTATCRHTAVEHVRSNTKSSTTLDKYPMQRKSDSQTKEMRWTIPNLLYTFM